MMKTKNFLKRRNPSKNQEKYIKLCIPEFDKLLDKGIPTGSKVITAGGPGTGKTLFCLQALHNASKQGHDCVYLTLEEPPSRLLSHLRDFNFEAEVEKEDKEDIFLKVGDGKLALRMLEPIKIARSVEAMLEKASGRLPVDVSVVLDLVPQGYNPYMIALDSISAMQTAFTGEIRKYRIYIEQLFRYFRDLGSTSFLVTETNEAPKKISKTGVEEFLTDGIIVFYYKSKRRGGRIRGVEIVKMRGAGHSQKAAFMRITSNGLRIFPEEKDIRTQLSEE